MCSRKVCEGGTRVRSLKTRDLAVFALLAAVIFTTQLALFALPGIQLNGLFIAAITVTYRKRALIPIYVYVMIYCLYYGFSVFNIMFLYIWLPLWGMFMLAPRLKLSLKFKTVLYSILCGLFGLSFGTLSAPIWIIVNDLNREQALLYIESGFFFADVPHAINNAILGTFIIPLSKLLTKLDRQY